MQFLGGGTSFAAQSEDEVLALVDRYFVLVGEQMEAAPEPDDGAAAQPEVSVAFEVAGGEAMFCRSPLI